MRFDYDLFVVGAGSGGLAAAKQAASYGARVAIAEQDSVGGTCAIRGCIPKKLMVYASRFPALFHSAAGYGWSVGQPSLNWEYFITAIDQEVQRLSQLHSGYLTKAGVELMRHHATFLDPHTLEVGEGKVTAEKILIAVGGRPLKPNLPGMEYAITSDQMFHLSQQPQHLAIIGAGYIGVEFAAIMQGLGTQVTQIIRKDLILRGFELDIRARVQAGMTQHGIQILTNTLVNQIERVPEGLKLILSGGAKDAVTADVFLAATGRVPNIETLGLENAGVEVVAGSLEGPGYSTQGAIAVNDYSCTSQPNIFAVGDCTNRINLTPVAIGEGRAFADTEFGHNPRFLSHENVPSAVFSTPEAATVGMSEAVAREKFGDAVKCYRSEHRSLFHSLTGQQEQTLIKLVVDCRSERVLGAHMVGEQAAEIIQGMAIAINMGATKKDFDRTLGIHPTTAEEFVTLRQLERR